MMDEDYGPFHPDTIKANAEAERITSEARAKVLEARAKMNPVAQIIYSLFDGLGDLLGGLGCLFIILIIVLAYFAPNVLSKLADSF